MVLATCTATNTSPKCRIHQDTLLSRQTQGTYVMLSDHSASLGTDMTLSCQLVQLACNMLGQYDEHAAAYTPPSLAVHSYCWGLQSQQAPS